MKNSEIKIGKHYAAKVSGDITVVRIIAKSVLGGWDARNIHTGREIRIKSAARLRREVVSA